MAPRADGGYFNETVPHWSTPPPVEGPWALNDVRRNERQRPCERPSRELLPRRDGLVNESENRDHYDGPVGYAIDLAEPFMFEKLEIIVEEQIGAKIGRVRTMRRQNDTSACIAYHGAYFRCQSTIDMQKLIRHNNARVGKHMIRFGDVTRHVHAKAVYKGSIAKAPADKLVRDLLKDIPYKTCISFKWRTSKKGHKMAFGEMLFENFYDFIEAARCCTAHENLILYNRLRSVAPHMRRPKGNPALDDDVLNTVREVNRRVTARAQLAAAKRLLAKFKGEQTSDLEDENDNSASRKCPHPEDHFLGQEQKSLTAEGDKSDSKQSQTGHGKNCASTSPITDVGEGSQSRKSNTTVKKLAWRELIDEQLSYLPTTPKRRNRDSGDKSGHGIVDTKEAEEKRPVKQVRREEQDPKTVKQESAPKSRVPEKLTSRWAERFQETKAIPKWPLRSVPWIPPLQEPEPVSEKSRAATPRKSREIKEEGHMIHHEPNDQQLKSHGGKSLREKKVIPKWPLRSVAWNPPPQQKPRPVSEESGSFPTTPISKQIKGEAHLIHREANDQQFSRTVNGKAAGCESKPLIKQEPHLISSDSEVGRQRNFHLVPW